MTMIETHDRVASAERVAVRVVDSDVHPVPRAGALWSESKEKLEDADLAWVGIGHIAAEGGGLLLIIALILGGIGQRKSRAGGGGGLVKASSIIATFLVAVYVVAIWAMGAKPT